MTVDMDTALAPPAAWASRCAQRCQGVRQRGCIKGLRQGFTHLSRPAHLLCSLGVLLRPAAPGGAAAREVRRRQRIQLRRRGPRRQIFSHLLT